MKKPSDPSLKVIDILETLIDVDKTGLGITEIANQTGLNISTVHRITAALTKRGYLFRNENTKKYNLSYKVTQFSRVYLRDLDIKELVHPYLKKLNEESKETVHLMQQDGNYCVFIDKIDSIHPIGLMTYLGKRSLMHCSAGGKVILAHLSKEERDRIIAATGLPRLTKHTITERKALEQELKNIKTTGLAWNLMEDRDDVIGVAAPIFEASGALICTISIAGPSYRFTQEHARKSAVLLKALAQEITIKNGFKS